ncbi:hypothetical protein MMC13_002583 [Lambiella insularis]|nr:hypothetical protein [Lambiella insularis]
MLFSQTALLIALAATASQVSASPETQYIQRAIAASPDGLVARVLDDRAIQARAANSYINPSPHLFHRRAGGGGGGGKGGSGGGAKGKGGTADIKNCREACDFCKGKKGADGKPCAYADITAPPGVDPKKFDQCRKQLKQMAGVNPSGMGAVSAGSGGGGQAAVGIVTAENDSKTKNACAGVKEQVQNAVSSGGGQCC